MAAPWAVSRQSSPPAAFADLTVERGILRRKSPRKRISLVSSSAFPSDSCLRSEEHTSELQSRLHLVCRLLLEKKKISMNRHNEPNRLIRYDTYCQFTHSIL